MLTTFWSGLDGSQQVLAAGSVTLLTFLVARYFYYRRSPSPQLIVQRILANGLKFGGQGSTDHTWSTLGAGGVVISHTGCWTNGVYVRTMRIYVSPFKRDLTIESVGRVVHRVIRNGREVFGPNVQPDMTNAEWGAYCQIHEAMEKAHPIPAPGVVEQWGDVSPRHFLTIP